MTTSGRIDVEADNDQKNYKNAVEDKKGCGGGECLREDNSQIMVISTNVFQLRATLESTGTVSR